MRCFHIISSLETNVCWFWQPFNYSHSLLIWQFFSILLSSERLRSCAFCQNEQDTMAVMDWWFGFLFLSFIGIDVGGIHLILEGVPRGKLGPAHWNYCACPVLLRDRLKLQLLVPLWTNVVSLEIKTNSSCSETTCWGNSGWNWQWLLLLQMMEALVWLNNWANAYFLKISRLLFQLPGAGRLPSYW